MNKLRNEIVRSPIQFLMNGAQLVFLLTIAYNIGGFNQELKNLQKTVVQITREMKCGFEANAAVHEKLTNAIILHTGKPVQ